MCSVYLVSIFSKVETVRKHSSLSTGSINDSISNAS